MRLTVTLGIAFLGAVAVLGALLAPSGRMDLFVVLLLITLLIIRELLGSYVPQETTGRLSVFIFAGLLAFTWIVVQRVREILNV